MTYLLVLVVQSDDPDVLVRLAGLAHRDVADARLAAKLLEEDDRLTIVTNTDVFVQGTEPSVVTAGRSVPVVTGTGVNEAGQPVVTFERVPVETLRIEASAYADTEFVDVFVALRRLDFAVEHTATGVVTRDDSDLLEHSFVLARDGGTVAQILRADTLLVSVAATTESRPAVPPDLVRNPVPAGIDHPRERRALVDDLLFDRP